MSLGYHQRQARGECGHCGRTLDQPPYRLCSHCYTPSQKRHTVQQAVQRSVPEAEPVIIHWWNGPPDPARAPYEASE